MKKLLLVLVLGLGLVTSCEPVSICDVNVTRVYMTENPQGDYTYRIELSDGRIIQTTEQLYVGYRAELWAGELACYLN